MRQIERRELFIRTFKGMKAVELIDELGCSSDHEVQEILAKATGNFKRGNERLTKDPNNR